MPIQLLRVDERLIHGQVVVGWGNVLHPDHIVVVDDDLAASEWEQELYTLGLPPHISAGFVSVAAARDKLPEWDQGKPRIIILTRDVGTMARVAEDGALAGRDVNIGGIHYAPGRTEVLSYLYLDNAERAALSRLVAEGTRTTAQDLPGGRRFSVEKLLANGRSDE
jgi:PTS system mannose-specific IIB component/fructoselysine and glucoselysine-specific PTS system IIB component